MPSESLHTPSGPARRTVMAAAGAAGLTVALTACGAGEDSSGAGSGSGSDVEAGAGAGAGAVLGKTSDIPEGGGKVFGDVVVTQPTAGEYKAFSSKCTHQGCAVKDVQDGVIVCPCHNSRFSATDGSVQQGPATQALAAAKITVAGDEIRLT
ncbi:Rieske (2Fe-2S) protein [Streptomyces chromofuscus]|uniref:Cytochrome bc1 complex Rieske iron-sulfur subunit n=1 Tax=Streptomyces chromofuscus TaxID=42881 RepID=A0A7M2TBE9_STRCW|nr:Rieske (2Fe-2S) protein [Streptomyces chromofuscus]QOV45459.1 Rieske (2Fe-2S) protein [Streptomyces chromofuscus]GGS97358.1 iron-sulfur protein [Streptomyces chromofuscus]